MATKPTILNIDINTLSRAADIILSRKGKLTKNGLLNDFARAIAGPGRDWGFLKNRPDGTFVQPGLIPEKSVAAHAPTPLPASVWVVTYDEEVTWAPMPAACCATRELALDRIAQDHKWWKHDDHPFEKVMDHLVRFSEYTFGEADIDEDEANDLGIVTDAYRITITETPIITEATPRPSTTSDNVVPSQPEPVVLINALEDFGGTFLAMGTAKLFQSRDELDDHLEAIPEEALLNWSPVIKPISDVTITAEFVPQAWVKDYAIDVDDEGETEWTVDADEIQAQAQDNDYLRSSRNAPDWVRNWEGPFEIYLTYA
jgi:hypothetical protein